MVLLREFEETEEVTISFRLNNSQMLDKRLGLDGYHDVIVQVVLTSHFQPHKHAQGLLISRHAHFGIHKSAPCCNEWYANIQPCHHRIGEKAVSQWPEGQSTRYHNHS